MLLGMWCFISRFWHQKVSWGSVFQWFHGYCISFCQVLRCCGVPSGPVPLVYQIFRYQQVWKIENWRISRGQVFVILHLVTEFKPCDIWQLQIMALYYYWPSFCTKRTVGILWSPLSIYPFCLSVYNGISSCTVAWFQPTLLHSFPIC